MAQENASMKVSVDVKVVCMSSHMKGMHSLACLAEKLKQLMSTAAASNELMDCKTENQRNVQVCQKCDGTLTSSHIPAQEKTSPEIKQSCNEETPPFSATTQALFVETTAPPIQVAAACKTQAI